MSKIEPGFALLVFAIMGAFLALAFWPSTGLFARLARHFGRSDTVLGEDVLKALLHGTANDLPTAARKLGVSNRRLDRVIRNEIAVEHVSLSPDGVLQLTQAGHQRALQLVRAHRLWERYLADRTGLAEAEWHESAERQEHLLTPEEADRLAARIGQPLIDPHGDPIPGIAGDRVEVEGVTLARARVGESWEITHLEDEPTSVYKRLVHLGFAPGEVIELLRREPARLLVGLLDKQVTIDVTDAESINVKPAGTLASRHRETLAGLKAGARARVLALAPTVHGPQRRRLLDLGFVPGTEVVAEFKSAMGEPMAFRVRGALIALRSEQAAAVLVEAA